MDEIRIAEAIDHPRRRFFGAAAVTIAAAQFGMIRSSNAQKQSCPRSSRERIRRSRP